MFSPIVRSAQRISTRNWAHSSTSLASLQIAEAKCNANFHEQPSSLVQHQPMSSASQFANSVAVDSKFEPSVMKNRLTFPNLLEDIRDENVVQKTSKVEIYHHFQSQPNTATEPKLNIVQQKALKKFVIAEEMLKNDKLNNQEAIQWMNEIKIPLLRTVRARTSSFIVKEVCCSLIDQMGDIADPSTVTVIGNPGAGILSHQFLSRGAKQLVLFEQNANIRAHLEKIHKNNSVTIVPESLFGSNSNGKNCKNALNTLLEYDKYTRVKIVHVLNSSSICKRILTDYTSGVLPFNNKHVDMYLVAEKAYGERLVELEQIDPLQKLVKFAVAWRTFIKSEFVCVTPADAFFPSFAPKGFKINPRKKRADEAVVLRCTFRPINRSGRIFSVEERYLYSIFIRYIMTTSSAKVINSLEKWIPGIGIRLIREGISLFTCFNQLSREEFQRIFHVFLEMAPSDSMTWKMMSTESKDYEDWL